MKQLKALIKKSKPILESNEEMPEMDYSTKEKALTIIYGGYTALPDVYQKSFLDPLKGMILTYDYNEIVKTGGEFIEDCLASVNQRITGYLKESTHAFEESIADLYDGFLSMEERRGIKKPDYQAVSPLVKWGRPDAGPYTWPADVGTEFGMSMSIVSMPPAYSKNIALWAAVGHETGGHDILHADKGLLTELGNVVKSEILKQSSTLDVSASVNGRDVPLAEFAAEYWKFVIDETASDVCGLLNLGPAAGIGLAVLLIPLRRGKLVTVGPSSDVHPIDAFRIMLAAEVVRDIPDLDVSVANAWGSALEKIVDGYIVDKKGFGLYSSTSNGTHWDAILPYEGMRETIRIVAKTIAFTPLHSLEDHHLSEINTWSNADEVLTLRIADDLMKNKEPSLAPGPDKQIVYAAHILSGAMIALTNSAKIPIMTKLAIKALNKLYDSNPVWRGFPVRFRSDAHMHHMVPNYRSVVPRKLS